MLDLSVVIPAFNEADRLPKTLTEILGNLAPSGRDFEVLVVDDGSTDNTASQTNHFREIDRRVRLLEIPCNHGKGYAVRFGVLAANGSTILLADADGATPFTELAKLEFMLDAGSDIAIGTRAARGSDQHIKAFWYRKALGFVFNAIVNLLMVDGFTDTQCGFKLFRRQAARDLFLRQRLDGFSFDVEILLLAKLRGFKVKEVAIDWIDQPGSKVNLLIDPLKMLRDLLLIRWWTVTSVYDQPIPSHASPGVEEPVHRTNA
ncbi:MAG: glycosyltransferase family 2 protein [Cyanobacteria bacterium NC_groundwater_1444_Ag_S-0.65um_54_12]|nr:glycosyltransferase family 2 protein [Cyanobacteria bacterium NC_groundwater_1444_Ag_S-0.65um_54_12]